VTASAKEIPRYRARQLRRSFRRGGGVIHALEEVSLEINRGEFVAISGPSGSGKTTLLHAMGLLDPDFDGELFFDGDAIKGSKPADRAAARLAKIGFIFQGFHLLRALNVRQNVALPRWRLTGRRAEALDRADKLLERLGLGDRASLPPHRLSAGEMQRVAIARAIVNDPAVLLADEPTGNLDQQSMRGIISLFSELHGEGHTLVVISHDPEVVAAADRVIALRHGRLQTT